MDDPLFVAVHKAWEAACQACVAAATCRNKVHGPPPPTAPLMERRPWGR